MGKPRKAVGAARLVDSPPIPLNEWDVTNWPSVERGEVAMLSCARVKVTVDRLKEAERLLSICYPKLQLLSADDERHAADVRAFVWGPPQ